MKPKDHNIVAKTPIRPKAHNRMARWLLGCFLVWLLGVSVKSPVYAQDRSPEDELKDAINSYEYGDLAKAIKQLRALLFPRPGKLRTRAQRAQASRYLGFAYFSDRKRFPTTDPRRKAYLTQARRFLEEYILFNPFLQSLDPAYYPPDLVRFYTQLRQDVLRERPFLLRRTPEKNIQNQVLVLRVTRQIKQANPFLIPLPFGVPQFENGHLLKASLIAGGSVVALAMNVASFLVVDAMVIKSGPGAGQFRSSADANAAFAWQIVQFSAIGIFGALWVYGIVDGAVFYQSQRVSVLPELPKVDPSLFRASFRQPFP